jgi:hypothetical protein
MRIPAAWTAAIAACARTSSSEPLVELLCSQYGIAADQADRDVTEFLAQLADADLLEDADGAAPEHDQAGV